MTSQIQTKLSGVLQTFKSQLLQLFKYYEPEIGEYLKVNHPLITLKTIKTYLLDNLATDDDIQNFINDIAVDVMKIELELQQPSILALLNDVDNIKASYNSYINIIATLFGVDDEILFTYFRQKDIENLISEQTKLDKDKKATFIRIMKVVDFFKKQLLKTYK